MHYDFDKSIGKITQEVSKTIGKKLEDKFIENGYSLKAEEWSIISMLYKHKTQNQRDISAFMGFDKVRIKRLIDRLENDKLVRREGSKTDKRFNNVTLTTKGKDLYKEVVKYVEEVIDNAIHYIPVDEINACLNTLEQIKNNLIAGS